ncbi:spore coat protein CotJB [Microaerobacter geothermalis]|uniref:spore coat protein CotJB n=1 Tax=Microaerobacter geothermalis TaxID=674972 RepID=UPI001F3CECB5|nr:spore coat protein CotJB [Microaerobacter geothermalis]MCF6094604.1 spore coat protein CotJB [Microaerobacter geothermalis]
MSKEYHRLVRKLQEVQFGLVELQLYLDTHPEDHRAIAQYNMLADRLQMLKAEYESHDGPIAQYGWSKSPREWVWVSQPWPWEIEY